MEGDVLISPKCCWELAPIICRAGIVGEHNLDIEGCAVRCIRGSQEESMQVFKTYTVETEVHQAFWCQFPHVGGSGSQPNKANDPLICLFVVEKSQATAFSTCGEQYNVYLPFQVKKAWPIPHGVLFERHVSVGVASGSDKDKSSCEDGLPTLFALVDPLGDIRPLAVQTGGLLPHVARSHLAAYPRLKVIYTSNDLPLIVTYDVVNQRHAIHFIYHLPPPEAQPVSGMLFTSLHLRSPSPLISPAGPIKSAQLSALHSITSPAANLSSSFTPSDSLNEKSQFALPNTLGTGMLPAPSLASTVQPPAKAAWGNRWRSRDLGDKASPSPVRRPASQVLAVDGNRTRASSAKRHHSFSPHQGQSSRAGSFVQQPTSPVKLMMAMTLDSPLAGGTRVSTPQRAMAGSLAQARLASSPSASTSPSQPVLELDDKPLQPDLAVELVWQQSDFLVLRGCACKVVVFRDFTQQLHLCLLSGHDQRLVKIPLQHGDGMFHAGTVTELHPLVDVEAVCDLGMMLVLSTSGEIQLYDGGGFCVGKLRLNGADGIHATALRDGTGHCVTVQMSDSSHCRVTLWSWPCDSMLNLCLQSLQLALPANLFILAMARFYQCMHGSNAEGQLLSTPDPFSSLLGCLSQLCGFSTQRGAELQDHFLHVLLTMHLVYEEAKLNVNWHMHLLPLASLLIQMASQLALVSYVEYYVRDHPSLSPLLTGGLASTDYPPSVIQHLMGMLSSHNALQKWPLLPTCKRSCLVVKALAQRRALLQGGSGQLGIDLFSNLPFLQETGGFHETVRGQGKCSQLGILGVLADSGLTEDVLKTLPVGIATCLQQLLCWCRHDCLTGLPASMYQVLGHDEIVKQLELTVSSPLVCQPASFPKPKEEGEVDDGMSVADNVLPLLFPLDQRLSEMRRLLQSAKPTQIDIEQKPEVSDHDFATEQQRHLLAVCLRTLSLPVGRGAATLSTFTPPITEPVSAPTLCLSGRSPPPRSATIQIGQADLTALAHHWSLFHNGVGAGLREAMISLNEDRRRLLITKWIQYNRPAEGQAQTAQHGGFLLALGMQGLLSALTGSTITNYLRFSHLPLTVGLLLGLACTYRGTCDLTVHRMLAIHVAALRPSSVLEVAVAPLSEVAAVHGVGLLFLGSGHRHMAEVMLAELEKAQTIEWPGMTDGAPPCEAYALACGLSLGMIMLQQGDSMGDCGSALADLHMANKLYQCMVGGRVDERKLFSSQPKSALKITGGSVNIHVTAPGAILALALMFLKSGNVTVAGWLSLPQRLTDLAGLQPSHALLRILARHLVVWDDIRSSKAWLKGQVPSALEQLKQWQLHSAILVQVRLCVLAGTCLAMGLRFAGSGNQEAFEAILEQMESFISVHSQTTLRERSIHEMCLSAAVLALSLVMAGSGNLEVLRVCRLLHSFVDDPLVTYGTHMATHLALGFLFLGSGRYSFSTSAMAIAALLCSIYPVFPSTCSDNRHHLQALRHLYVLAAEPRLLAPHDVLSNKPCQVPIYVRLKEATTAYPQTEFQLTAPCLLPELHLIKEVAVESSRYWPVRLDFENDAKHARQIVQELRGVVFVKRRADCLSYMDDPKNQHSCCAKTFSGLPPSLHEKMDILKLCDIEPSLELVIRRTEQSGLRYLFQKDLDRQIATDNKEFCRFHEFYVSALYDCVSKEQSIVLPTYCRLYEIQKNIHRRCVKPLELQQLQLVHLACEQHSGREALIDRKFLVSVCSDAEEYLRQVDTVSDSSQSPACAYLAGDFCKISAQDWSCLSAYLLYHNVPLDMRFSLASFSPSLQLLMQSLPLSMLPSSLSTLFLVSSM